jgi:hypothetical protein
MVGKSSDPFDPTELGRSAVLWMLTPRKEDDCACKGTKARNTWTGTTLAGAARFALQDNFPEGKLPSRIDTKLDSYKVWVNTPFAGEQRIWEEVGALVRPSARRVDGMFKLTKDTNGVYMMYLRFDPVGDEVSSAAKSLLRQQKDEEAMIGYVLTDGKAVLRGLEVTRTQSESYFTLRVPVKVIPIDRTMTLFIDDKLRAAAAGSS